MAQWDPDLHRRQAGRDDAELRRDLLAGVFRDGGGVGTPGTGWSRWRPLLVTLVAFVIGLLLAFVGPVPGLGLFMVMGSALATPAVVLRIWLG